jgi:hypothetical protein
MQILTKCFVMKSSMKASTETEEDQEALEHGVSGHTHAMKCLPRQAWHTMGTQHTHTT